MFVSAEVLTTVIAAVSLCVTFVGTMLGAGGWLVHRMDAKIDAVDDKLSARIDGNGQEIAAVRSDLSTEIAAVRSDLSTEIAAMRSDLRAEIAGLRGEVTEVKIAVARIEGPRPHFVTSR
ncbi:hypothetical protein GCM10022202_15120 [Microbacterium marinilacus]|uniref:Response regulator n=1 Tax=Microbacterium marinilacus TaxID=415209 RepID=A0ABP7BBT1_9MICO